MMSALPFVIDQDGMIESTRPPKPDPMPVIAENIPATLKALPQWICWKWEWTGKKWDKPPHCADGHGKAKSNDPATWTEFDQAVSAYQSGRFDGIGIVLTKDDPFCGVDLDKCIAEDWPAEIISTLASYTEITPSGNGYRVLIEADAGAMRSKMDSFHESRVEVYDSGRYFTVTGRHLSGTPKAIHKRQSELESACKPLVKATPHAGATKPLALNPSVKGPMSRERIVQCLDRIPNIGEGVPYEDNGGPSYMGVMMAVHHETNGQGFDLFQRWSGQSSKQSESEDRRKWASLTSGGGIAGGSLVHWAGLKKNSHDVVTFKPEPVKAGEAEPLDLFGNLSPTPLSVDMLPASIGDFAADQAELMGVDLGIIGLSALCVAAACLDDRITIQPKRFDPTWKESARLWVAPVGDPSTMKSPGISKALGPTFKINKAWRKDADAKLAAYEQAVRRWQKKVDKGEENPGPQPEKPMTRRLIYEDATIEALGKLLSIHEPRGALVFRDELSGWLSSMDQYKGGGGSDRAAWLESYNGGPFSTDRIGRGSMYVDNWSACILGGIQPSVIHAYAQATNHDGMLQRFILYFARSAVAGVDRYPDMEAKEAYERVISHIAGIEAGSGHVSLSDGAHVAKELIWAKLDRLIQLHPNKFLVAALGKWKGTYARLLLTYHAIECAETEAYPQNQKVSRETAQKVSDLMTRVLLPHAIRFYSELDPVGDHARLVAGVILAHTWERFTVKRDLDRYLKASRIWKPWETDDAVQRLESFGWIEPEPNAHMNERRRPSAYIVNPLVHERFAKHAEAERKRRREVIAELATLKKHSE